MANWKEYGNPFLDFTEEITQKWINCGFNKEQTKEWLNIGLKTNDADYAQWLRDIKKVDSEWLFNHRDDIQLREEYESNNLKQIIKKESQKWNWGNVIEIISFLSEQGDTCAIIINQIFLYAPRIVTYQPASENQEERILTRITPNWTGYHKLEDAQKRVQEIIAKNKIAVDWTNNYI